LVVTVPCQMPVIVDFGEAFAAKEKDSRRKLARSFMQGLFLFLSKFLGTDKT
jgi:hypothetical protein